MIITYETIQKYVEAGLITCQVCPWNENWVILNYTPECQFDKKWDDVTLQCRGLIMDKNTNEVIARPFPKFFNYEEWKNMGNVIPDGDYIVMDKMDGSLGILYWHDGQPYISTRGSFTSDQAKWATDWIRKPENFELIRALDKKQTHLFEIIYPENRIVLAYDFSGLVYLGNRDIETGQYNPPESSLGFRVPERLNPYLTIDYIKSLDTKNKEGVVLYYPAIQMWLKVKFDTYVKLHKVMTGLSERGIWELLQSKGINSTCRDLVQDVPDEFYSWMELILEKMKSEYMNIEETAQWQFGKIEDMAEGYGTAIRNEETGEIEVGEHEVPPRSWWAQEIKKMEVPALGFAMLDKKDYAPFVFKMIKPTHHKTFRNETDL